MATRLPCLRRSVEMLSVLLAASAASDVPAAQHYAPSGLVMSATGHDVMIEVAVEPLTSASAASKALEREAKLVPFEPHYSSSADFFAFINCDVNDGDQVNNAFIQAVEQKPMGVIFYATEEDYCQYTGPEDYGSVFTTTNKNRAKMLRDAVSTDTLSSRLYYPPRFLKVQRRQQNTSNIDAAQNNALGPTPSTSVALIILYSITGVITALFLLIIVSGAIRAHRHPERYGPRATARFGQPRQSRAKGIARAVLDTLPIVRFSATREDVNKPTDVEMNNREGSHQTAEQRASEEGRNLSTEAAEQDGSSTAAGDSASAREEGEGSYKDTNRNEQTAQHLPQSKCPVCMDDFEQDQEVRVLPCQHSFHPDCIDPWLLNVSGSCPLCRNEIEHDPAESAEPEEGQGQDSPVVEVSAQAPVHNSRFSRYLDLARGSTGQERLAALRQLREENIDGDGPATRRRSLAPELGFARLRQVFHRNRHSMARTESQAESTPGTSTEHVPESVQHGPETT